MKHTNTQAQQAVQGLDRPGCGQLEPQDQHWRFIELNTTRALRGKEAARVEVEAGGRWLWMSRQNVIDNIRDFGDHPELHKALEAYAAWN